MVLSTLSIENAHTSVKALTPLKHFGSAQKKTLNTFSLIYILICMTLQGFEEGVQTLGVSAFDDPGQQLYTQIMTKHAWLNRDPTQGEKFCLIFALQNCKYLKKLNLQLLSVSKSMP